MKLILLLGAALLTGPAMAQPFIVPLKPERPADPPPAPTPVPVAPPQAEPSPVSVVPPQDQRTAPAEPETPAPPPAR